MIEIKLEKGASLDGYTLIEGFPGAGLVGPMAISYIIDKLAMRLVGYIESSDFPPIISIHKNVPMPPVRIYANDKQKIITILAEFAIPMELTHELAEKVYNFVRKSKITKIVSIGGIPASQDPTTTNPAVFSITSTEAAKAEALKAGLSGVTEGVATGVSALLMIMAMADNMPDIDILVEVSPTTLDPKYAEIAIVSLNKLINLNVNVDDLEKEAREVESKMRNFIKRNKETQDAHKKATGEEGEGPSMYA